MNAAVPTIALSFSESVTLFCTAFISALFCSLILVPLCRKVALCYQILDKPGGRKEHAQPTPLLGGVGVVAACILALLIVMGMETLLVGDGPSQLRFSDVSFIFLGSIIIFLIGLLDDFVGERLPFYYKLVGQIVGSSIAIAVLFYAQLIRLINEDVPFADYVYLFTLMMWMLTVINSFNFSDNINGLSTGLAVIALLTALVYLGIQVNARHIVLGLILTGAIFGFMPFNFPRARIFLGDAGSMFIGYWVGVMLWPMTVGFFDGTRPLFGIDTLIPPVLVMGVPIYDAGFVVFMRWREGRPIYLGDNKHLSHRLVRCGFSRTESTLILWGVALVVGGIGAMSISAQYWVRYIAFVVALVILLIITVLIVKKEKKTALILEQEKREQENKDKPKDEVGHGSRRIRADVSS